MSHTPVPWRTYKRADGSWRVRSAVIASSVCTTESREDAELIVRAVNSHYDLLEELKEIRGWFRAEYSRDDSPEGMFIGTSVEKDVDSIDAVIAKAEGQI